MRKRIIKKCVDGKKVKREKSETNEDRIKYGKGLGHETRINIEITGVNNGYMVKEGYNNYVFNDSEEVVEFVKTLIPLKGTDKDFINCLGDDEDYDLYDDDDEDEDSLF